MFGSALPESDCRQLDEVGFAVIPGPVAGEQLSQLAAAYDVAMANAAPRDGLRHGRSTTRVHDFVYRGPEFDCLYIYPPILAACCQILYEPFKLSSAPGPDAKAECPGSSGDSCGFCARRRWLAHAWFHFHGG